MDPTVILVFVVFSVVLALVFYRLGYISGLKHYDKTHLSKDTLERLRNRRKSE